MEETITLSITCPCIRQASFQHTVTIVKKQGRAPMAVQIDCPFGHEKFCLQQISVQLPRGSQPAPDNDILRGE